MTADYEGDGAALGEMLKGDISPVAAAGVDPDEGRADQKATLNKVLGKGETPGAVGGVAGSFEPPDYSDVPAFLKQSLDMSQVLQVPTAKYAAAGPNIVSDVDTDRPYRINVDQPDKYTARTLNHELVHTHQATRNPNLPQPSVATAGGGKDVYDYGGIDGLVAALNAGRTVADFNLEQQARMVEDYKALQDGYLQKAQAGKATLDDARRLYAVQQAYHPMVRQLAAMPGANVNLDPSRVGMLLGLTTAPALTDGGQPAAPGLPAPGVAGMNTMEADPLLGGMSQTFGTGRARTKGPERRGR